MGCLTSWAYGESNDLKPKIYHRRGPPSAPFATGGVEVESITVEEVEQDVSTSEKAPLISGVGTMKRRMKIARFSENDFITPITVSWLKMK